MDFDNYMFRRYCDMRDLALRQLRHNIGRAKTQLDWAKIDRKHGYRTDYLESLKNVAYYREEAMWWYARYKKKCKQIADLENEEN